MKNKIGSFSLMKRMNTSLILGNIRSKGQISRIELAKATGLTAATVTNITSWLIDNGFVEECSVGASTGGRKPVLLRLRQDRFYAASAYISPVGVEFAVSDFGANIIYRQSRCFDGDKAPEVCTAYISEQLKLFCESRDCIVAGLGLGVHGITDAQRGDIVNSPILKWKNVPVKSMLSDACGLCVYPENDVRLMATAERWYGTASACEDFVYLYVGSGVGSAVISSGSLLRGVNNAAGEIGHSIIDPSGPVCECGKRGCLQAHTGEGAMLRTLQENLSLSDSLSPQSTCADVFAAYKTGDKAACAVVEREVSYLSAAVFNIANLFDPSLIVVGSGIDGFCEAVVPRLSDATVGAMGMREQSCPVCASVLGSDAVLLGGIATVLDRVCEDPARLLER